MNQTIPYLNEWLELSRSGRFDKAQEIYFEKLFASVIDVFKASNEHLLPKGGVLFSILGYSPEPIILTAKAIEPDVQVIFTTNKKNEGADYLEKYLGSDYETVYLQEDNFDQIYKALKEQLILNPTSQIVLDITGGKKSMVASAAIFGKDYGCKILYVDFKEYIKDLRKPLPGSEILNIVYDPFKNQPELFQK
jgi:CRISPR-associated protein (Cas_Cas02710)